MVILHLDVLIQYRHVTVRRTDRRTHDDSIYRASIASRGKSRWLVPGITLSHSNSFNKIQVECMRRHGMVVTVV